MIIKCKHLKMSVMIEASLYFWKQLLTYFGGVGCRCHEASDKDIMAFMGHNLLGCNIMLVCDKCMGKDTTCIKELHHNYPDVPLFQGIKYILKFL